jgi:phage FluMu gp28-like protein
MCAKSTQSTHAIDSPGALNRYFLPYQRAWILDDAPLRLAEKSVRIGWTFADAFKNVRKRLQHRRRDYLFTTKDHSTALEYVRTCHRFAEAYDFTRAILSRGVEDLRVPRFDSAGRDTGFTDEVKAGVIRFDNGSRILAFSSNPNALRAFGGDVGLDEFAFHSAPDQLWAAASGRVTWGYDLGVWSSSNGDQTLFHTFAREAQAQIQTQTKMQSGASSSASAGHWSYYRVTLLDAVNQGLVEAINRASGRQWTREQFIEDCRSRARLPEIFEQEYMCNPRGGTLAIVPWEAMERCLRDTIPARLHLEAPQITELFGAFTTSGQAARESRIQQYLAQAFAPLFGADARWRVGFDVAASGEGDLAVIYIDSQDGPALTLRGLLTCRTEDWHFLKTALFTILKNLPGVMAAGDETGLGRQICWEAAKAFPGRFLPVNFRSSKSDMGFVLMDQLSAGNKILPRTPPDIAADFFALRKTYAGGRWIFTEGANPLNPASHCDIAWAGALSTHAAAAVHAPARIVAFPRKPVHR